MKGEGRGEEEKGRSEGPVESVKPMACKAASPPAGDSDKYTSAAIQ